MNLILWRHAEAEDGVSDLKRELTQRGQKQAAKMAAWLKSQIPVDARVVVSPAMRTRQTAEALTSAFEVVRELAPGKGVAELLAASGWSAVRDKRISGNDETVIVVGHQPTLGATAALLIGGAEAYWSIKKGAVWWLSGGVCGTEVKVVLRAVMSPGQLV